MSSRRNADLKIKHMVPFISTIAQDMKWAFEVLSSKNFNQAVRTGLCQGHSQCHQHRHACSMRSARGSIRIQSKSTAGLQCGEHRLTCTAPHSMKQDAESALYSNALGPLEVSAQSKRPDTISSRCNSQDLWIRGQTREREQSDCRYLDWFLSCRGTGSFRIIRHTHRSIGIATRTTCPVASTKSACVSSVAC